MARPRKKLTQADISRNSSIKITGTINKIKANERKYTTYLVITFMFLFMVIGYFTLKVNTDKHDEYFNKDSLSMYSKVITLNEKDVLSDEDGLKQKGHSLNLYSGIKGNVKYRILIKKDDTLTGLCDCSENLVEAKNIKCSINGSEIITFTDINNMVIDSGMMQENESKAMNIKLWLNEGTNTHFHGKFILERVD